MMDGTTNPGTLDPSFGVAGIAYLAIPNASFAEIDDIILGPDGKIYYGGSYWGLDTSGQYFIGRLDTHGNPDPTFGDNGIVIDNFGLSTYPDCHSIMVMDDGKVLWVGELENPADATALARHNADGSIDSTFGKDGKVVHDINLSPPTPLALRAKRSNGAGTRTATAQLLPDGKILISKCHAFGWEGPAIGVIIRLNPNGSLDTSLNQIGYFIVSHPDYRLTFTELRSIMVQADGKYLGCGAVWDLKSPHKAMFVRYDSDGELDTAFGKNGFALFTGPTDEALRLTKLAPQHNRRILGVGSEIDSNSYGALISIEPDGSPNIQFNRATPLLTRLDNSDTFWEDGIMQPDGKIVVAGGALQPLTWSFDVVVARFLSDGKADPDFNNGQGWVRTHLGEQSAGVAMRAQADKKIVVLVNTESQKHAVLRYLG